MMIIMIIIMIMIIIIMIIIIMIIIIMIIIMIIMIIIIMIITMKGYCTHPLADVSLYVNVAMQTFFLVTRHRVGMMPWRLPNLNLL